MNNKDIEMQLVTVKELCDALQRIPEIQDLPVVVDGEFLEGFQVIKDYPIGDSANPWCEYCDVLAIT